MKVSLVATFVAVITSVLSAEVTSHLAEHQLEATRRKLIVGGSDTDQDRYRYMVCIAALDGRCECGGSLISPNKVLTAAHCSSWFTGIPFDVRVGEWNQEEETETPPVDVFAPGEYLEFPHPAYVAGTAFGEPNDIMVIHLTRDVATVQPVHLDLEGAATNNLSDGDPLQLMGWGNTNGTQPPPDLPDDQYPDILQEVTLNFVPNDDCKDEWSKLPVNSTITDDMLCVASPGKNGCFGDSGGPLIVQGDTAKDDVVVAIVSFGYLPCDSVPGVLVRVAAHYDFLSAFLNEPNCDNSSSKPKNGRKGAVFIEAFVFSLTFLF